MVTERGSDRRFGRRRGPGLIVWQSRGDLAASVARLFDCAGDQALPPELTRIRSATERANAVALALTEVAAIDRAPTD
jgi:hypothetical protein